MKVNNGEFVVNPEKIGEMGQFSITLCPATSPPSPGVHSDFSINFSFKKKSYEILSFWIPKIWYYNNERK